MKTKIKDILISIQDSMSKLLERQEALIEKQNKIFSILFTM